MIGPLIASKSKFVGLFPFTLALVLNLASASPALADNFCRTKVVRSDALDFPSRHAWNIFVNVMHPAMDTSIVRGEPDCSKKIGTPGTTSVWETWRLARTEVFLADGSEPPAWEDLSLPSGFSGTVPPSDTLVAAHDVKQGVMPLFDPNPGQSIFVNRGGIGETRMNRTTFDFIRQNCLFSKDGLKRYAAAVAGNMKPEISFPVDSIEVKAVWLEFDAQAISDGKHKRYYNIEQGGKTYGLTSFHMLTKDVPNWFWATFHHIDAPDNAFELPDLYGRPRELNGTVWENYELGGTQTDFISAIGKPTILSDHYIEFGFQKSSCIGCHAMAHGSPEGVNGEDFDDPSGPIQTTDVGAPIPDKFNPSGVHHYIQTDFLWSIPFRAKAEATPPPTRCQF
jgi:hypothetical protein